MFHPPQLPARHHLDKEEEDTEGTPPRSFPQVMGAALHPQEEEKGEAGLRGCHQGEEQDETAVGVG